MKHGILFLTLTLICQSPAWATLPRWYGFNLLSMFVYESGTEPEFQEDDFRIVRDLGFNFIRLPLDYRYWIDNGDWRHIDGRRLEPIDRAIGFGQKYGLHVQLCFLRAPGYCVNGIESEPARLFSDERALEVCELHWAYFARRYRGIPNKQLSFNLINEPPKTDEGKYALVANRLATAIHSEDPARLVVSDGMDGGAIPVPGVDDRLMQSLHVYCPHPFTHYLAGWAGSPSSPPVWPYPCDAPSGVLAGPGKATLQGSLSIDDVPADSVVRLRFEHVSGPVRVRMEGDGALLHEEILDPKPNAPGWRDVRYYPEWKLYQGVYMKSVSADVTKAVSRLTMSIIEGDWAELSCVELHGRPEAKCVILPVVYCWQRLRNEHQRFLGWSRLMAFAAIDASQRRYPDDGREWLYRNVYRKWDDLLANGREAMIGEIGVFKTVPHALTLSYLEDNLRMARERNMGVVFWNLRGSFGVLDSERNDVVYEEYRGHRLDRKMLDLIRRYTVESAER